MIGAGGDFASFNLFAYCLNNPVNRTDEGGTLSWGAKILIGSAVILALAIVTVATAGTGTALACAAAGALEGAVTGAAVGAVSGAATGAITHRITTGSWEGAGQAALEGAADGYMLGSITGAITGGMNSNYCFVAGTLVQTKDGTKPIEEIEAGDQVWAWDEETGEVALKPVLETYINETEEMIHVYVNGEEIVSTPGHPFYSPVNGWTDAVHLRAGDILVLVNGEYVVVEKVQHELLEAPINVYSFNVDGFHIYYVSNIGVLVHNSCGETGSYEINFRSGKNYVGKGGQARMKVSAKLHELRFGDKAISMHWDSAANATDAIVDEYLKMAVRGVNNPNTYNIIWSPGRKLFIKAMETVLS